MAIGTPFHPRTAKLCKSNDWRHWSGYYVPLSYGDFVQPEYAAIRHSAALIDVSPLYKYGIEGPDAAAFCDRVFTQNMAKLSDWKAVYTPWCDSKGKLRQEGTVFRFEHDRFQLNAAEPALRWLELNRAGFDVEISDRSGTAALAVQGPNSRKILTAGGADIADLSFFGIRETTFGGTPVTVSRTGYTGDLGYEIWLDSAHALKVWDDILDIGDPLQITPSGLQALDMARIEAGFILISVDYVSSEAAHIPDDRVTPYEVGLGWAVKLDKGNFVGRDALTAEKRKGPQRSLVGLEIEWKPLEEAYLAVGQMPDLPLSPCREPVPVYAAEGPHIGRATTRIWSTLLKKYIALATIDSRYAATGTHVDMEITVQYERKRAPAKVVKPQFYRPRRMRA